MRWLRTILAAFLSLRRNIMRSILTILGIVIGVGAVITMMEIGTGSKAAMQKTIASLGTNVLMIFPGASSSGGVSWGASSVMTLTPGDVEAIRRECPSVRLATARVRLRSVRVVANGVNWVPDNSDGVDPDFFGVREWPLADGEYFSAEDVQSAAPVCLLGQTASRQLFGADSPVGQEVRVQNVGMRVVGLLERKGADMRGSDQDDCIIMPWTTAKYRVSASSGMSAGGAATADATAPAGRQLYPGSTRGFYPGVSATRARNTPQPVRFANVDQIVCAVASGPQVPDAMAEITAVLRERHRVPEGELDDFTIRDMAEIGRAFGSTTRLMTTLLLAVASISLVVGGVGIMNIMLVSVTERTREIGLRMAVGARGRDIMVQFLTEAVVLCLCGGLLGIAIGRGTSVLVGRLLEWPVQPSLLAIAVSVLVSVTVGVAFGFYPAWKAARLDPIDALRYE